MFTIVTTFLVNLALYLKVTIPLFSPYCFHLHKIRMHKIIIGENMSNPGFRIYKRVVFSFGQYPHDPCN